MGRRMERTKFATGLFTGVAIGLMIAITTESAIAGVNDNSDGVFATIAEFLGVGKEANVPIDYTDVSLVEKVNYLAEKVSQVEKQVADAATKDDIGNIALKIDNIEVSANASSALQATQLLDSFKSSGKKSVSEWNSSYVLQRLLATSDVAINSEYSGYMLDWCQSNDGDLHNYLSLLDNYGGDVNINITDMANSQQDLIQLCGSTYAVYALQSTELRQALDASMLKRKTTHWSSTSFAKSGLMLHAKSIMTEHTSDHSDCTGATAPGVTLVFNGSRTKILDEHDGYHYSMSDYNVDPYLLFDSVEFQNGGCSYGSHGCSSIEMTYIDLAL